MQNEIGRLRKKLREGRAELFSRDARTAPCRDLLKHYTLLIDGIVREIYDFSCHHADGQAPRTPRSLLAIVATGGYGRGELNPCSDIDIAFIPGEQGDPWVETAVHVAFRLVMDVFLSFKEIRVGYSYRPVAEVPTWDLVTKTALLDLRHLCGDAELSSQMDARLRENLVVLDLLLELEAQSNSRSGPAALSLYAVEPNLKEGPGSLRDLHRARWILRLLTGGTNEGLYDRLLERRLLDAGRVAGIRDAEEWFWAARNWLHITAGKKSDILINNYQDRIARELGGRSSQDWLAEHYRHSETLASFRQTAVRAVHEGPVRVGGIALKGGFLRAGPDPSEEGRVHLPLQLLHLSQRYGIPIGYRELRLLEKRGRRPAVRHRVTPEESWEFLGILRESRRVAATLRAMTRLGLMDRFVNGFSYLMRYVPPDPAHRYTVGDHSIRIIEHLEALRDGLDPAGQRFSELLAECVHFDMLCLAALLHDVGKLKAGVDHCEAGVVEAFETADRLQLPPEKREVVEVLVRHHTLLVRTGRLQDLKSAAVIQQVAAKCRSVEVLRHLYVFSYADTRAVAERNWTSMDYRDLEDLYHKVRQHLGGQTQDLDRDAAFEDRIGRIRRRLAASEFAVDEEAIRAHCDAMPAGYVLNTPLEEIAFHLEMLQRLESEKVIVDIYNRPGEDFSELTVCTYDDPRPGLLAKITGVLYACNVDIHRAQVYTMERARPVVLDTLWVRSGALQLSENRARRIRNALGEVLTGRATVEAILKGAGKQPPATVPVEEIELRNDLSEEHTVVHIIARDLQGLLHLMTRALSRVGLDIHSARVATWNARAENNFYVTTLAGTQIPGDELEQWRNSLRAVLSGPDAR
ncbi:MAG: hypothetical protein HXY20_00525 [Acidobacteria bacterium]|nr:hypothetical protein [Acidobacteriota bacterium]